MKKEMKFIALYAIPHAFIIFFCLITIFSKTATPFITSFGIDSNARVYICESNGIGIYYEGKKIDSIDVHGSNYLFTIEQNDCICVAYTSYVEWLDTSGSVLMTKDDPNAQYYSKLSGAGNSFISVDGDTYTKIGELGWTCIIKNNSEVVYRQDTLSFIVKLLIQTCIVSMFVCGVCVIQYIKKQTFEGKQG